MCEGLCGSVSKAHKQSALFNDGHSLTELTVMCAVTGQRGKPTRRTHSRIPIPRTPVTTHRNNDIKTGDHGSSKSVKSSFTNT